MKKDKWGERNGKERWEREMGENRWKDIWRTR
jgi:hypothetical protein